MLVNCSLTVCPILCCQSPCLYLLSLQQGSHCLYLFQFIALLRVRLLVLRFTLSLLGLHFITSGYFSQNIPITAPVTVTLSWLISLFVDFVLRCCCFYYCYFTGNHYTRQKMASGWNFDISEKHRNSQYEVKI